jgi:hypothetical protein
LQGIELVLELVLVVLELLELVVQRSQMVLDRWRGVLPFLQRKGKRPGRVVGVSLRWSRHGPRVSRR